MNTHSSITRIEQATLPGGRPRSNGCNARLGAHGADIRSPVLRVIAADGSTGFGWGRVDIDDARALLGMRLDDAFLPRTEPDEPPLVRPEYRSLEYPLYDLVARAAGVPVYQYITPGREVASPLRARCYDTSLYMDDLDIDDDREAAELIAGEALEGFDRGHRGFKIKVGRGGMHMEVERGTRRDIMVINAVRAAVGGGSRIMIDANNGYNLNLTKRVLAETAESEVYWVEEAFHEDATLYRHLKAWMDDRGVSTLIADGEGDAATRLEDWAKEGLVDVLQYDIRGPGFAFWLDRSRDYDRWGVRSAPHHYGGYFCNYAAAHLSAAVRGFEAIEWDECDVEGLSAPGYSISDGLLSVPVSPGFGIELDMDIFCKAVSDNGYVVETTDEY